MKPLQLVQLSGYLGELQPIFSVMMGEVKKSIKKKKSINLIKLGLLGRIG